MSEPRISRFSKLEWIKEWLDIDQGGKGFLNRFARVEEVLYHYHHYHHHLSISSPLLSISLSLFLLSENVLKSCNFSYFIFLLNPSQPRCPLDC